MEIKPPITEEELSLDDKEETQDNIEIQLLYESTMIEQELSGRPTK